MCIMERTSILSEQHIGEYPCPWQVAGSVSSFIFLPRSQVNTRQILLESMYRPFIDQGRVHRKDENNAHWNETFELTWTPPMNGTRSPNDLKIPCVSSWKDWQHALYCCWGHWYAPTGVRTGEADAECEYEADAKGFNVGDGVKASAGVSCPSGMAVVVEHKVAKMVKSGVRCMMSVNCADYLAGRYLFPAGSRR
jgi:hypothetical protein